MNDSSNPYCKQRAERLSPAPIKMTSLITNNLDLETGLYFVVPLLSFDLHLNS